MLTLALATKRPRKSLKRALWNVASSRRIRSSKGRIWTKDYVIENVSALITAPTFILPASQQSRCAAHNLLEIGLAKVAKHLN